jgi:alanyl-tRNA synthetase
MKASEIRKRFLEYFEKKGHTVVPSAPLIPREDPSLMFTNAGMVQFKRIFLGQRQESYNRATSSQKCLRVGGKHNDLENVGRTARHHTFFEMLGNFSFGDYFKREAITFAWDFLTKELKLPADKLHASVYLDDDEAYNLWVELTDIPPERIHRLGEKDNFWSMGDTGPCGPCSEIHIDQGEDMACGPDCALGVCDCDRFLEIWNLVFMQYDQVDENTRLDLPKPSIDTGMGLERIAAVCQGVRSNYESDLFQPIIQAVARKAGVRYKEKREIDTALQVIADHSRAIAFLITDRILPSNEGRGYILRRLIRRAFRFGRFLGLTDPFLFETVGMVVAEMGEAFPELLDNRRFMVRMVREEEERFSTTLDKGLALLEETMAELKAAHRDTIPGDMAFRLYDTYGFPLDIVNDVAERAGLAVDAEGFNNAMAEQRQRAKKAWKGSGEKDVASAFQQLLAQGLESNFVGYDTLCAHSPITRMLDKSGELRDELRQGETGFFAAEATPFYGESGGQGGDAGVVSTASGEGKIVETLKPSKELTVHRVEVTRGALRQDEEADLRVDEALRTATARNHTCTHLLHAALRKILGEHVKQSGSLVTADRLRFDFTHIAPLSPTELRLVEEDVNRAILDDLALNTEVMPFEEAAASGAMALFDEKYGGEVRVVRVPGYSAELCGGTHLRATGQAGMFMILSETGVAAGIRRIEATTGFGALKAAHERFDELEHAAGLLKGRLGEIPEKIKHLQGQIKEQQKQIERLEAKLASGAGADAMDQVEEIAGIKVLAAKVEAGSAKSLRDQMDALRSKLSSGIICLAAATDDGKVQVVISVSKDLHGRITAPALIKPVAAEVGGGGGGRPDMAQAGGSNPSGIDKAFAKLKELAAQAAA